MDRHALKIPCNAMPFICEADYSVTLGRMIHADRALRIRKAKQLLQETDKPVTEIAQLTGFSDVFYFSKVFRAKQGCSPSDYRKTYIPGI